MRTAPGTNPVALTGLKIDFLSPVTRPAHEGAVALLMKRADYDEPAEKRYGTGGKKKRRRKGQKALEEQREAIRKHDHFGQLEKFDESPPVVMTGSIDGHSHLVFMRARAGETTWQTSAGSESGHDHPWMLTQAGDGTMTIEIGDSEGHSHTVDQTALNAAFAAAALKLDDTTEDPMPKTDPKTTTKSAEEIAELETNLELARLHGSLNDGERSHFDTLGTTEKTAFVMNSPKERAAKIKKAAPAGPIQVYKDLDGHVFTDEDDPRLVAAAKRADDATTGLAKAKGDLEQERLEKRAAETFKHLPGTPKARAALLKSVEAIEDEGERTEALAALTAGDQAIAAGFDERGTAGGTDVGTGSEGDSPTAKLNKMAAKYATDNSVTEAVAFSKVLETPDGKLLYKESVRQ
jgi:hypothetical protein